MKRRIKRTIPSRPSPPLDTSSGCWSVVLIDGEPVRKKARRDYEKVLRDLEKCKGEVERFETEDAPLFSRWLNSTFGSLITEARELNQRLVQARDLVSEVQQEHFFGGHRSIAQAYQKVMEREEEERQAAKAAEEAPPEEDERFSEEEEAFFGDSEKAFREFASSLGFDLEDEDNPASARAKRSKPPSRLKELYRAVVRRLHPDKMKNLSPKEIEWWHQAQAAYEQQNVEELELILTLCEVQDRGTRETSVSLLGQLVSHFKSSLRALKRRLTQCKRDPAWGFSKLTEYSSLHSRAEGMFREQIELIRAELQHYEGLVAKWKVQAATRGTKETRRSPRSRFVEEEFLF